MKSSQWLFLWSMLCSILARLQHIDGQTGYALYTMFIAIICVVLAVFFSFQELKQEREKSAQGDLFYTLALNDEKARELFAQYWELKKPGDSVSLHEKDGRRLVIYKA